MHTMEISGKTVELRDPTTTGGRNGADLNWGGWWPTGVNADGISWKTTVSIWTLG